MPQVTNNDFVFDNSACPGQENHNLYLILYIHYPQIRIPFIFISQKSKLSTSHVDIYPDITYYYARITMFIIFSAQSSIYPEITTI